MKSGLRWLLVTLAALAVSFVSAVAALAETTVTVAYWPGPESDAMQQVVNWWNANKAAQEGFRVRLLTFSRQDYFTREMTALGAGSTEFDVAFTTTYIVGEMAPYLEPLDNYFERLGASDNLKIYIPSSLDSLRFNGKLYGIPTDVSNHFLYYRKDFIQRLLSDRIWQQRYREISQKYLGKALEPKQPSEWGIDDYVAASLFFTQSINPDSPTQYGTVLQLKNLIFNVMIWNDLLWGAGGRWLENGEPVLTSPAAVKALDAYGIIIRNRATPPDSLNYEYAEANAAFGSGRVATMIQWSAAYHQLTDKPSYPEVFDKVALGPVPGNPHATHVHSLGLGINAASPRKEQAARFLAFLASRQAMELYAKSGGLPPVSAVLGGMADTRPEFPLVAEHVEKYGYVEYTGPETRAILQALADHLSAAWAGKVSTAEALKRANEAVRETLNKN